MTHRSFGISVYLVALIALCDQISKWVIVNQVMQPPHVVPVTSFLNLVLVMNHGMTFGLLNQFNPRVIPLFLIGIALIIIFLLGRWLWRSTSTLVSVGLGFIMGGAIGNVIDRLHYGAVVDFLDFYIGTYHWFAFNLADSAIDIGIGFLLLDLALHRKSH